MLQNSPSSRLNASDEIALQDLFAKLNQHSIEDALEQPRIVIVGDQSSGKTSLFEALTGLTLQTGTRSPTHFAVHVRLRHIAKDGTSVRAYLVPGQNPEVDEVVKEHISSFNVLYEGEDFTGDDFAKILSYAEEHLGLPGLELEDNESYVERFSDAVLNVEISGPKLHNINVVDLPGLMYHTLRSQIHQDIKLIRELIMSFISAPRTVILAVADATNNVGNQMVFKLAKEVDPHGLRTVGVLTKCDAIQPGDEKKAIRVAQNKSEWLPLGWIAVKNRSTKELEAQVTIQQRNAYEKTFFEQEPWNILAANRTGIVSLKLYITDIVNDMIQEGSNGLLSQIQALQESTQTTHPTHHSFAQHIERGDGDKLSSRNSSSLDELDVDLEAASPVKRPIILINACTVALTSAFVLTLVGLGARSLAQEVTTDFRWGRIALLVTAPLQIFVSLFFCQSLINSILQIFGPVHQTRYNSRYYTAFPPRRLNRKNGPLPHVTIQCPVYKEGLEAVIMPTVRSLQAAMRDYESHGGTSNIFINDDGMQIMPPEEAEQRKNFYLANDIGWVARPKHDPTGEGLARFARKGKFKKASNMNFGLAISIKVEDKLSNEQREGPWTQDEEENAYVKCLNEVLVEEQGRAWAAGDIRVGDYILIVDSDTRVPAGCFIDAVSELEESRDVAILQFPSGVMNVTTTYFENGITFFTNLIYTAIRFAVASGDVSPFVGHNAFLRWTALQETSFYDLDEYTGLTYEKFWSESHVSEDFDISLRLQSHGWVVRLAGYCGEEFKEGVSLTVYDELARWEKYAYGCNELLFHPVKLWLKRGPLTPLFKQFMLSNMPIGSKITIMAYIGTYYAIGYAWIATLMNYFLIGWLNGHLDHYYMDSWRVWVALIVIFSGCGNLALAMVRYRSEGKRLSQQLLICFQWVPLLFIFLGGISMHVSQAILAHMFSIDMSWGATSKEVVETSFFIELPLIASRFKYTFVFCIFSIALMVCGVFVFPPLWRIDTLIAIFPLSCIIFSHFLLPVALNPALMKFTW